MSLRACRSILAAALGLLAAAPSASAAKFELTTFKNWERSQDEPSRKDGFAFASRIPGLSVVATWTGGVRPVGSETAAFLLAFGKAIERPDFAPLYTEEVELIEQGRARWVPLQASLLPDLRAAVKPGEDVTVDARYLGAAVGALHVYAIVGFDEDASDRVPRTTCFAAGLLGVTLGEPLEPVLRRLEEAHGMPVYTARRERRTVRAFIVDRTASTQLVVSDAGAGARDHVYGLRVTGPPNLALPLLGPLALGSPAAEVEAKLGPPAVQREREGTTLWTWPDSPCSVEVTQGRLTSVLVTEDPNHFTQ